MDRQLRILIVGHTCSPLQGSEPGGVWNWASRIAEHHRVWLISHPQYRQEFLGLAAYRRPKNLDVRWISLPRWMDPWDCRGDRGLRLHYILWLRAALKAAQTLHSAHRFDIVHHVGLGTVSVPSPFWRLGVPLFWGPIGGGQVAPAAFRGYFGPAWRSEWLRACRVRALVYSPALRRTVAHCSTILATNQATVQLLKRAGARDVRFFPDSGVPEYWLSPATPLVRPRPERVLIWWGRLEAHKALGLGLEALAKVKNTDVRLWVAGEGSMRSEWEALTVRLGLTRQVRFLGRVSRDSLKELAANADAFLFTSLRESFGSVVLEAMGMGLPVITLDHHGMALFLSTDAGFKVPVSSPDETADNLARAIESFAGLSLLLRQQMAEAAWNKAKEQNWGGRVAQVLQWYAQAGECSDSAYTDRLLSESFQQHNATRQGVQ
jgi:glycosyltransferase involved in cell wall biosynthesis